VIQTRERNSGKPPQPLSDKGKSCDKGRQCTLPKTCRYVKGKPPRLAGGKVDRRDGTTM
jgi:hypothetical protein